jgi:hypothetical protein
MGGGSYVPSVIRLLFLMNAGAGFVRNRNTRTFDIFKINIKSKVVLAKIPGHFLVGNRGPPILYARLHRSCSSHGG